MKLEVTLYRFLGKTLQMAKVYCNYATKLARKLLKFEDKCSSEQAKHNWQQRGSVQVAIDRIYLK